MNAERRIQDVLAQGSSAHTTYKLKDTTRIVNSNAKLYTPEQKKLVYNKLTRMLYYFGYVKHPEGSDLDWTVAMDHPENHVHDPKLVAQFGKFRQDNDETIAYLDGKTDEQIEAEFKFQPSGEYDPNADLIKIDRINDVYQPLFKHSLK